MSIAVRCNCGQAFKARDDLAGRTVKCPMCRGWLTIPKPPSSQKIQVFCTCGKGFLAQEQLAGRTVKCPSCGGPLAIPLPALQSNSIAGLLDEADAEKAAEQQREEMRLAELRKITCIECGAQLNPHSSLCRSCGYSYELGRKIRPQAEANWERWARESNLENAAYDAIATGYDAAYYDDYYHDRQYQGALGRLTDAVDEHRRVKKEQKALDNWLKYI